jgi:hypothetical protein
MTRWLTVPIFLFLLGCANVDPGPPPVDVDLLATVVAELNLAQSVSSQAPVIVRDSIQAVYFDEVLADHDLTRPEFDSLMWIVREEPVWVDTIYSRAGEIVARRMVGE